MESKKTYRVSYEECIRRSRKVHGDKYTYYAPDNYNGTSQRIKIKCNKCGNVFKQTLSVHYKGSGCPICGLNKIREQKKGKPRNDLKKIKYGCAYCDCETSVGNSKPYLVWSGILQRCFSKKFQKKEPTYINCRVCDEWLLYSNFEKWYKEHYVEGYEIDKDLLSCNNNKIYSPNTCVFLPKEINRVLRSCKTKKKHSLPTGVFIINNEIIAKNSNKYLGIFPSVEKAQQAYFKSKKEHIIRLANKWKDNIERRAYNALINLDVVNFFNNK